MRKWVKSALHRIGAAGVGMALLGAAGLSQAEPRIQAITSSIQGGTEVVKIDLSEPLSAVPAGFVVQSPARIALDFPGVGSELQTSERLYVIAETYGQDKGNAYFQTGLRYWIVPNRVQIDTTYGSQFSHLREERWISIGLRLISPALF